MARSLPRRFFRRSTVEVARDLLGGHLVRRIGGERLVTRIVEVEAYCGEADTACHASRGRTARTEVMFGPPGHAYVYFTYGMHWLLNVVTEPRESPCAVLIRGVEPVRGLATMRANRGGRPDRELLCGPARLTQALRIDGTLNAIDLVRGRALELQVGAPVAGADVVAGPRIGVDYADPEHRDAPWRFYVRGSIHVSRPRR